MIYVLRVLIIAVYFGRAWFALCICSVFALTVVGVQIILPDLRNNVVACHSGWGSYMSDNKRVALTIFVDETLWRNAKAKFGRSKDQSFQRVGESLFRAWAMQGMPMDSFDVQLPKVDDPIVSKVIEYMVNPSSSTDALERAAVAQAAALQQTVEVILSKEGA